MDIDDNGYIDEEEFASMNFAMEGMTPLETKKAMDLLDTEERDGKISLNEFILFNQKNIGNIHTTKFDNKITKFYDHVDTDENKTTRLKKTLREEVKVIGETSPVHIHIYANAMCYVCMYVLAWLPKLLFIIPY